MVSLKIYHTFFTLLLEKPAKNRINCKSRQAWNMLNKPEQENSQQCASV